MGLSGGSCLVLVDEKAYIQVEGLELQALSLLRLHEWGFETSGRKPAFFMASGFMTSGGEKRHPEETQRKRKERRANKSRARKQSKQEITVRNRNANFTHNR